MEKSAQAVSTLSSIANKLEAKLKKLGIHTTQDLLFYFPLVHEDRRNIAKINTLSGSLDTTTIRGKIELIQTKRSFRRRQMITEALVSDSSAQIRVVWFGNRFVGHVLKVGDEVYLTGRVYEDKLGLQMRAPEYEKVTDRRALHAGAIIPRYPLTKGVSQKQIRLLVSEALKKKDIEEWLPDMVLSRNALVDLGKAIKNIHFPDNWKSLRQSERRLKFDELFFLQMRSALTKSEIRETKANKLSISEKSLKDFVNSLPFTLTDDQRACAFQIILDMKRDYPMNRMLQGDVGSGKTVVAALAMLNATSQGYTSILMAPTEILARQHYDTLIELFDGTDIKIGLYTRSSHLYSKLDEPLTKRRMAKLVNEGELQIIVGTHALLFEPISVPKCALAVVDEQHRFGVNQRREIKKRVKDERLPHFLSMTATPIPRSVALTLYGELDVSVIKQKPKGRKPIITKIVSEDKREAAFSFIRNQLDRDRQAFVVCPLIDSSKVLEVMSVKEAYDQLKEGPFINYSVEMLHGKMKPKQKEEIYSRMVSGEIDVLVSTSVIEVGVDVPNATVMMIEGAERFGLAQLHQFRGRIGRSHHQSYCMLFPTLRSGESNERLQVFSQVNDGFLLASYDLEMRGPGDMYGKVQSGFPDLKIATLKDHDIIAAARGEAEKLVEDDSDRIRYPKLWAQMSKREEGLHLE